MPEDSARGAVADGPLDIAVVGMAGLFAGSAGLAGFWNTTLTGKDVVTEVSPQRWDPAIYYAPGGGIPGRHTVSKWGGFLPPVAIDPIRFGIPPSALGSIDPSQLLALEVADQALSDAGYPRDGADHSRTGVVFAAEPGSDSRDGLTLRALLPAYLGDLPPELDEQLPAVTDETFPGHLGNVVAGRIANRLDLGAANFTVDAACAASLAAVDVACKQLTTGAADLMLCGAVDLHNSIGDFLMFGSVHALSPRGKVATFDAAADGTALGEGVGCVTLKRLADAERDGDRVYAVIKGVGAASDGRSRSLTAPLAEGQVRAMREAYRQAGVSPGEVELLEAHGTGTVLGDQTELDSLTEVFTAAGAAAGSCVLGSVKSQIGHAKAAAGLAGLIRAALAVYTGVQPPTSNLSRPNEAWDADRSPFVFLAQARPWLTPAPRRFAGLSAFGFGGINFHAVLSGHPGTPEPRHTRGEWPAELFCFRGADAGTAHRRVRDLLATVAAARPGGVALRDLAVRAARDAVAADGPVQVAVVARDTGELAALLDRALAGDHDPAAGLVQPGPGGHMAGAGAVAFLFPGQGSQRPGALADLFVTFSELRQYLDIGHRWAGRLFPPAAFDPARERGQADLLRDTRAAQPVLGICGLAVSHLLGRLGVRPDMAGGHSYGELVALATAGAFGPATLLELSEARAAAMLSVAGEDPGTMAAVSGTAEQISAVLAGHGLTGEVTLANLNAPSQVVISGRTPAVTAAVPVLEEAGLPAFPLPVACGFHSPVVASASERFAEALATVPLAAPRLPVWSNRTAAPHCGDPEAVRAEMAAQISAPVRFADQVEAMYAAGARVFVEAGPGHVLTGLVRSVLGDRPHLAVACDGQPGEGLRSFLTALAQLACAGADVDLTWLFHGRTGTEPAAGAGPTTSTELATTAPAASAGGDPQAERPLWIVDGQLIRDSDGNCLPGALVPAHPLKEFPVSPSPSSADRDTMLAEYLRASREMVTAQRDVMLAFLGDQAAGQLAAPREQPFAGQPSSQAGAQAATSPAAPGAVDARPEPAAPEPAAPGPEAPGPEAPRPAAGPGLQAALVALISERTGYPGDLIEPDLDLEAELSINSIKRMEIAVAIAGQAGLPTADRSALLGLVKARTVRAMMGWLTEAVTSAASTGQAGPEAARPVGSPAPANGKAAAQPGDAARQAEMTGHGDPAGSDDAAGTAPLRLLRRLVRADSGDLPPVSVTGARFVITGGTPVASDLAGRLGELGAHVRVAALDAVEPDDVRDADGLVLLDGLGGAVAPLPPAVFPLVKAALTGTTGASTRQRWLLAAADHDCLEAAGLAGLFRTIAVEHPGRFARFAGFDQVPEDEIAASLVQELLAAGPEPAVNYVGDTRYRFELAEASTGWARGAAPGRNGPAGAEAIGLTGDSVIVLIGGARGITARIARELAAASRCRIELVGRTQPPDAAPTADGPGRPQSGPGIEAAADAVALRAELARQGMRSPSEIERATRDILAGREVAATLAELREAGAQARYHCADAQDAGAIHQILKQVHKEHGRIDGLVYGAGVIEDQLIAGKDPGSFARVFDTKVTGARAALAALAELPCTPRFTVLFGSTAAVYGSRGQADYAAANDALEALGAAWAASTGHRCLTVHWGPWAPAGPHPGMVTPELSRDYDRRGIGMIDPHQGASVLLQELAWGDPALRSVIYTGRVPDAG